MKKRFLSLLLSFVFIVSSFPVSSYADEVVGEINEEIIVDDSAAVEEIIPEELSEKEPETVETSDQISANNLETLNLDVLYSLGYHEMDLTSDDLEAKDLLNDGLSDALSAKAGIDYDENTVVYLADTYEKAKEVADCYGAEITFYENSVAEARIDFSEEKEAIAANLENDIEVVPDNIDDVFVIAADKTNNFPAVFPNYYYSIDDDFEIAPDDVSINAEYGDYFGAQWYHDTVNDKGVWNRGITGEGVTVAIIDTGVDLDHEDLASQLTTERYSAYGSTPSDAHGHGSHVAGIVAAAKNSVGGTGVAYNAKIMPIKALNDNGKGSSSAVISCINYATEHNADIINMSLGSPTPDKLQEEAVKNAINKGIIVVASAGNEGNKGSGSAKNYPGAIDGVISVGALASTNDSYGDNLIVGSYPSTKSSLATFNSYVTKLKGMPEDDKYSLKMAKYSSFFNGVSIMAPGTGILSCNYDGGYWIINGTSQASPIVAGICALMLQQDSSIMNMNSATAQKTVKQNLLKTAVGKSYSSDYGTANAGAVDCYSAVFNKESLTISAPTFSGYDVNKDKSIVSGPTKKLTINNSLGTGKIYYTTDGSDPSDENNTARSTYTSPITMDFGGSKTIKAVIKSGLKYSEIAVLKAKFVAPVSKITVENKKLSILPGKSAELVISYEPEYALLPKYTFTSSNDKFKGSGKGVIKVDKSASAGETATITVTDPATGVFTTVNATAASSAITEITLPEGSNYLSKTGINLSIVDGITLNEIVLHNYDNLETALKAAGNDTDMLLVKSSKPGVVEYKNGKLIAKNKGKANITITANDGSKVNTKIKVNVLSPVTNVNIVSDTGFVANYGAAVPTAPLGVGNAKVKLKASLNEGGIVPDNKKVTWSSSNENVITVSKSGQVQAVKGVTSGSAIITATANDGTGRNCSMKFELYPEISSIGMYVLNKNGKSKYSSSVNISGGVGASFTYLNYIYVNATTVKGMNSTTYLGNAAYNDAYYQIKCSDKDFAIADPDNDNSLLFNKAGKKSVTIITRDGSNKKITFNVTIK